MVRRSISNDDLVCYCFQVTRKEIEEVILQYDLHTVSEVSDHCDACLGCRTCYPDIEQIIGEVWQRESSAENQNQEH